MLFRPAPKGQRRFAAVYASAESRQRRCSCANVLLIILAVGTATLVFALGRYTAPKESHVPVTANPVGPLKYGRSSFRNSRNRMDGTNPSLLSGGAQVDSGESADAPDDYVEGEGGHMGTGEDLFQDSTPNSELDESGEPGSAGNGDSHFTDGSGGSGEEGLPDELTPDSALTEGVEEVLAELRQPWPKKARHASSVFADETMIPAHIGGQLVWIPHGFSLADAQGIVLLLHGCGHTGEVWATGAEERGVVRDLVKRRLWPIAVTAHSGRRTDSRTDPGCWDSSTRMGSNADAHAVTAVTAEVARRWGVLRAGSAIHGAGYNHRQLASVKKREKADDSNAAKDEADVPGPALALAIASRLGAAALPGTYATHMPILGVGASSGAAFLSLLATRLQFAGMALYIMPPAHAALMQLRMHGLGRLADRPHGGGGGTGPIAGAGAGPPPPDLGADPPPSPHSELHKAYTAVSYPPLVLLHMPRDVHSSALIEHAATYMVEDVGMIQQAVVVMELLPRRIDGRTFNRAMPWLITPAASGKLYSMLLEASLLTDDPTLGRGSFANIMTRGQAGADVDMVPQHALQPNQGAMHQALPGGHQDRRVLHGRSVATGKSRQHTVRQWGSLADDPPSGQWLATDPRGEAVREIIHKFAEREVGPHDVIADAHVGVEEAHSHDVFDLLYGAVVGGPEAPMAGPPLPGAAPREPLGPNPIPVGLTPSDDRHPMSSSAEHVAARLLLKRNLLEVLNERFAQHEMSSQYAAAMGHFLESTAVAWATQHAG